MSSNEIKKCIACGKRFAPRNSKQVTCLNPVCQEIRKAQTAEMCANQLKIRKCNWCGKRYQPKRLKQKYCCRECGGYAMQKTEPLEKCAQYTDTQCHFNDIAFHPGCTGPADYNFCPLW